MQVEPFELLPPETVLSTSRASTTVETAQSALAKSTKAASRAATSLKAFSAAAFEAGPGMIIGAGAYQAIDDVLKRIDVPQYERYPVAYIGSGAAAEALIGGSAAAGAAGAASWFVEGSIAASEAKFIGQMASGNATWNDMEDMVTLNSLFGYEKEQDIRVVDRLESAFSSRSASSERDWRIEDRLYHQQLSSDFDRRHPESIFTSAQDAELFYLDMPQRSDIRINRGSARTDAEFFMKKQRGVHNNPYGDGDNWKYYSQAATFNDRLWYAQRYVNFMAARGLTIDQTRLRAKYGNELFDVMTQQTQRQLDAIATDLKNKHMAALQQQHRDYVAVQKAKAQYRAAKKSAAQRENAISLGLDPDTYLAYKQANPDTEEQRQLDEKRMAQRENAISLGFDTDDPDIVPKYLAYKKANPDTTTVELVVKEPEVVSTKPSTVLAHDAERNWLSTTGDDWRLHESVAELQRYIDSLATSY